MADLTIVKKFSDAKIQDAIDGALASMLPESSYALVAHADGEGFSVSAIKRFGTHLSVEGAAILPYHGKIEGEAQLVWQG